ncbi:MAG: protein TolQ [Deltaproteobacteria bacterium]|nr:protein TolQ [Deltaproteobacteria bacterium]
MTSLSLTPIVILTANISLGDAFSNDIVQMFIHAGLVVKIVLTILIIFSIISWAIIFTKWRLFRRAEQETDYFLDLFWENTEFAKIFRESNELLHSPVANIFKSGYLEFTRFKKMQGQTSAQEGGTGINNISEYVERSLRKTAMYQSGRLEKALSFLATTGNATPFIGLFGTVWGIMESFRGIGMKGSASLAVVAPGISEALIATAAGLAAAIPAVIAFNYFNSKVNELKAEMDTFMADFMGMVERQAIKKYLTRKKDQHDIE